MAWKGGGWRRRRDGGDPSNAQNSSVPLLGR